MALKSTIKHKCPKCGKIRIYHLINGRELRSIRKKNELAKEKGEPIIAEPRPVYMCEFCGQKIIK